MIDEDGEVAPLYDPGLSRGFRELPVVVRNLPAQVEPLLVLAQVRELVGLLLAPRLHREVRLAQADIRLGRVRVLDGQIACVARQMHVLDRPSGARADGDHLARVRKMVVDRASAVDTGGLRLLDRPLEVAVIRVVAQDGGEIARRPILASLRALLLDLLERRAMSDLGRTALRPVSITHSRTSPVSSTVVAHSV